MDIILSLVYFLIFLLIIYKSKFFTLQTLSKKRLLIFFGIKTIFGVILTIIYTKHYPERQLADTFKYFDDSQPMFDALLKNPSHFLRALFGYNSDAPDISYMFQDMNNWYKLQNNYLYNDNRTMIRINAVFRIFSFGSYHVHMLFFSMIGFLGLTMIYKSFEKFFLQKSVLLQIAAFLIPSVLLWSSGVLKEAPIIFFVGLTTYALSKSKTNYPLLLVTGLFLFFLKFYVFVALLPTIVAISILKSKKFSKPVLVHSIVHFGFIIAAVLFHWISPFHSFLNGLKWKKESFYGLAESMNSGSVIETRDLVDSWGSFVSNIPEALYNATFLPFPWDGLQPFSPVILASGIENTLMLIFILSTIFFYRKISKTERTYLLGCLSFVLIIFTLSGIVTPIIGTLVRYKTPALPFLLIAFFMLWDEKKLNKIQILKRLN